MHAPSWKDGAWSGDIWRPTLCRKIWATGRYNGWDLASPSSVHRAMARRASCDPCATRPNAANSSPRDEKLPGAAGAPQLGLASGLLRLRDHH